MARVLYLDCFSGISGDMLLGACLDAGLPFHDLRSALGSLAVEELSIGSERVLRAGISATRFFVADHRGAHVHPHTHGHTHSHEHGQGHGHSHPHTPDHPADGIAEPGARNVSGHRSLPEIAALVERSALSAGGKTRVRELFQRLAEAEAAIHQMPVEQVHLHEVGALDSIVDIVGAVFAMEWIGADQVICSPLNVGGGMVESAHGLIPVPAPATVRLLQGAPIYSGSIQKELVTPTGALLATSYATSFGPIPAMTLTHVGYGAGTRDNRGTPNVLRVLVGETEDAVASDQVVVIECEIDDMNPQLFGAAMDQLYAAGALDVFYVPVQMKKNRPGTLLTVIAAPSRRQALTDVIFRETTTIGVRHTEMARECLRRDWVTVTTSLGDVRIKQAWHHGRVVNAVPEFDDCAQLAAVHQIAVKEVQSLALRAYGRAEESRS